MDAYLCDAYVDCLASWLKRYRQRATNSIPADYAKEMLPIGPLFARRYTQRENWALRMAVRSRMERENVLQVSRAKELLNPALPPGKKLWDDLIDAYISVGRKRLTTYRPSDIGTLSGQQAEKMKKGAQKQLLGRLGSIVQRRHDIVHNVDRPKVAPQQISAGKAKAMIDDVNTFICVLDDHLEEHRLW